ncbi:helix-turn-helix transcriptional regulator [Blautia sp. HCP28S3_G10]|uniref:helix-turn-helix transcriptional regulator n=1 Tax=Blautia sp. HCP28S3_G10 TaxID=3438908 RepID=UPI003F8CAA8D
MIHFCTDHGAHFLYQLLVPRLRKKSSNRNRCTITFLQIIRDIELNQACRALRETILSNTAICELVGYDSPEHFMRTFKKAYGMTPGEYRKRYK